MILKIRKNYFIFGLVFLVAFFIFLGQVGLVRAQTGGRNINTFEKPFEGTLFATEWNDLLGYNGTAVFEDGLPLGSFVPTFLPAMMTGPLGIGMEPVVGGARLNVKADGTNNILSLQNNVGTAVMTVLNSGNVGVGTTNPAVKLTLQQADQVYVQPGATSTWDMALGIAANTNKISGMDFKNFNSAGQVRLMARNDQGSYIVTNMPGSAVTTKFFGQQGKDTALMFSISASNADQNLTIGTYNAGDLLLGTNNTERMRILSGGNVGIGTTNPTQKLSIGGSATSYSIDAGNQRIGNVADPDETKDVVTLGFLNSSLSAFAPGGASSTWALNGNNIYNTNSGNVGIGTTAPDNLLTVSKDQNAITRIQIENPNAGASAGTNLLFTKNGVSQAGNYFNNSDLSYKIANYVAGDMFFSTTNIERMRITSGGNVGIGTTAPGHKLSVAGSATNYSIEAGNQRIGNVADPDTVKDVVTLGFLNSSLSAFAPGGASSTWALNGNNIYNTNSGNVGIGTSTPGLDKLRVVGGPVGIFGSLNLNNNNITGINKLTVNTIDPLYNIGGTNYSTFAAAIVGGVKEEYVGRLEVKTKRAFGDYEAVIDFNKQKEGTDLWVWHKTVDFSKENVEVFLSPYGDFARTYFLIEGEKLIVRADRPVTVSYRLVGRRLDWREWPTKALDQEEKAGFVIN